MTFSDETVMAYADGELDGATRAALEAAMLTDPDLAHRVAHHRELRGRLHAEFDPVLSAPIPERLLAAATGTRGQARTGNIIALQRTASRYWAWPQWGALAAGLIVGVLIAPLLRHAPAEGPLGIRDGRILASGALAHALSAQLASNQQADAPVYLGVSFVSRSGDYCRTFTLRDKSAVAGLACRERERWRLEALAATRPPGSGSGQYQPAASALPPGIEQAVDALIVGEPLDAQAEAAASANDWRH
jgi:hypothetical protein